MINLVFAFASFIASMICLFLGNYVYYQNKKQSLNKKFFLLCLTLSWWAFTEFMYRQAENIETAALWINLGFLWPFSLAFALHFALIYTEKNQLFKNRIILSFIYGSALTLSVIVFITNTFLSQPIKKEYGYISGISSNSLVNLASLSWGLSMGFLAVIVCILYYHQVFDFVKKKQVKFISIGFSIPVFISFFTAGITWFLSIDIPDLTTFFFTGLCIFVGYAIYEYKLFILTPAMAIENIIETMADSLLLIDTQRKIIKVNPALLNLFEYGEDELIEHQIDTLFAADQSGKEIIKKFLENKTFDNFEIKYKTKSGKEIFVNFSGSPVRTEKGNIAGFVSIGHNVTTRKKTEDELRIKTDHLQAINLDLNSMNQEMTATNEELLATEEKLKTKIDELEKYKNLTIGRELKMIELKKEIDELYRKVGEKPRYNIE